MCLLPEAVVQGRFAADQPVRAVAHTVPETHNSAR